ncbi:MAG: metallophosphoesterase [Armatimonadetes bacterium]|nr:metallophosphoesterase [Armatimonadota bacterium]
MADLWVIHTNDLHGALDDAAEERLRAWIAATPHPLVLDAGDAIQTGNLGWPLRGPERMLPRMSDLGYHAMALGNRESHPRKEIFPLKLKGARFPVLCANITGKRPEAVGTLPTQRWLIREHGGLRVGVLGVTVPMFTRQQWTQCLCDYWFDSPVDVARDLARDLRPTVDVLIAVTHIGLRQDQALAEAAPELDLIVGGHSHTDLESPCVVAGVPIVQVHAYGYAAGRARLKISQGGVELAAWEKTALRDAPPAHGKRNARGPVRHGEDLTQRRKDA